MKERLVQGLIVAWTAAHILLWVFSGNFRHPFIFQSDCWPFKTTVKQVPGWSPPEVDRFIHEPGGNPFDQFDEPPMESKYVTGFDPTFISSYDLRPFFLYVSLGGLAAFVMRQVTLAKWIGGFLASLLIVLVATSARSVR